ncbi:toxin [Streptomyces boncukensis]|uniref:Toxin n=1 Tax=Streptomyces boncukensis TaxID=2711219 RepID=A0A6G4X1W1_9ACTN|nr:toxin [Streptomyces boncukensis]NGO71485.1 toxin [Streptomyces boncukensis]
MKGRLAGQRRRQQLRKLRRAAARRIAELGLPRLADVESLCRHLSEVRGRPITPVPLPMQAAQPCGMWLSADDEDIVFYDANTTSAHQEHIILHELGHIICRHRGAGWAEEESARLLFPNLDPSLVRDMLKRATYDDVQEQEAEVIAYLLAQHVGGAEGGDSGDSGDGDDVIQRVERTLE